MTDRSRDDQRWNYRRSPSFSISCANPIVAVGFACLAAGYAWFLRVGPAPDYPAVILPAVLLIGAAFGLGFSSLNIQATAGVADHEQGLASGILQTSFQVGGSAHGERQTEQITLAFAAVKQEYVEQTATGGPWARPLMGWDVKGNAPL